MVRNANGVSEASKKRRFRYSPARGTHTRQALSSPIYPAAHSSTQWKRTEGNVQENFDQGSDEDSDVPIDVCRKLWVSWTSRQHDLFKMFSKERETQGNNFARWGPFLTELGLDYGQNAGRHESNSHQVDAQAQIAPMDHPHAQHNLPPQDVHPLQSPNGRYPGSIDSRAGRYQNEHLFVSAPTVPGITPFDSTNIGLVPEGAAYSSPEFPQSCNNTPEDSPFITPQPSKIDAAGKYIPQISRGGPSDSSDAYKPSSQNPLRDNSDGSVRVNRCGRSLIPISEKLKKKKKVGKNKGAESRTMNGRLQWRVSKDAEWGKRCISLSISLYTLES